jgi:protein-S-isoprenylcysteine O-methyltransferase Ste14
VGSLISASGRLGPGLSSAQMAPHAPSIKFATAVLCVAAAIGSALMVAEAVSFAIATSISVAAVLCQSLQPRRASLRIMRRPAAVVTTGAFFLAGPCVVAGLVPWLISGWDLPRLASPWVVVRVAAGAVLVVAAVVVLVRNFVRFVSEGRGTPAPIAPPDQLVVGGDYRYVRNPMYVAIVAAVLGQALIFGSLALLAYAAIIWVFAAAFVRVYEEPALLRRFGASYERYRSSVRAWLPRLHPWRG